MKLYFKDESGELRTIIADGVDMSKISKDDHQRFLKNLIKRNTGIRVKSAVLEVI